MIFHLNHRYLFLLIVLFLILVFFPRELYLTTDSMFYLQSAESLVNEFQYKSFFKDIWVYNTHFPPVLSILIALISLTGLSYANSFLIFQILNLLICSFLLFEMTDNYRLKTRYLIFFSFILVFFQVFQMAWSEPLFLSCLFIILFFWKKWLAHGKFEHFWIFGFAVLPLIRYAGLFFIPVFIILYKLKKNYDKKFIINILLITIPIGLWILRNKLIADSATNRVFSFKAENYLVIWEGFITIRNFFLPLPIFSNDLTRIFIFIFSIGFIYFLFKVKLEFLKGVLLASFIYFSILSISIFTMDNSTPMDFRLLSPFILLIFLFLIFYFDEKYLTIMLPIHCMFHVLALNFYWIPNHKNDSIQIWAKNNPDVMQFINENENEHFIADQYTCNLLTHITKRQVSYFDNKHTLKMYPKGYYITIIDSVFVNDSNTLSLHKIHKNIAKYSIND